MADGALRPMVGASAGLDASSRPPSRPSGAAPGGLRPSGQPEGERPAQVDGAAQDLKLDVVAGEPEVAHPAVAVGPLHGREQPLEPLALLAPPPHDAVRQAKLPKVTPRHRPAPAPFPALSQKLADRAKVSSDLVRHSKHGSVGPFLAVRPLGAIVTTSRHRTASVQVREAERPLARGARPCHGRVTL